MDQIAFAQQESIKGISQLPCALLHEGGRGMRGDAGDLHAPCGHFHHHQYIIGHQAVPRRHLGREEVCRSKHLPMQFQKLRPAHARLPPLRSRLQVMAAEDIAYSQLVDVMPEVRQGPLETAITP